MPVRILTKAMDCWSNFNVIHAKNSKIIINPEPSGSCSEKPSVIGLAMRLWNMRRFDVCTEYSDMRSMRFMRKMRISLANPSP